MSEESAEIIELFGVRFSGKRDLTTGRIYVEATPESRAALTRLKEVGQGLSDGFVAREKLSAQSCVSETRDGIEGDRQTAMPLAALRGKHG